MPTPFDSFEDADMSEYTVVDNSGGFNLSGTNAFDGSQALDLNPNYSYSVEFIHKSASISVADDNTPFGVYFSIPGSNTNRFNFGWALQSRNTNFVDENNYQGYKVVATSYELSLHVDGTRIAYSDGDLQGDKYYKLEITTWDSDGTITVRIVDPVDDTVKNSLSAVDTTHTSGAWPAIGLKVTTPVQEVEPV